MATLTTDKRRQPPAPVALDALTFPLFGRRLIEASAGTGKTYTIASLYLRLLLGHGDENTAHEQPLTVDKILVVTFTEAATSELRDRIRARIHDARQAFLSGHSDDTLTQALLYASDNHTLQADRLLLAERQMDEAAIFTIHGFCQRMLKQHAFESGTLFNCELVTDESDLLHQAVADYWRHRFYPANAPLSATLKSYWKTPADLLSAIRPWLASHDLTVRAGSADRLQERHDEAIDAIKAFKQTWQTAATDLADIIKQSGVDKRSYSSRNLPRWLEAVSSWAATPTQSLATPEALGKFRQDTLTEKTTKGAPPEHEIFVACSDLLTNIPDFRDALLAEALSNVKERLLAHKSMHRAMSFDDLLTRLAAALNDAGNRDLAKRLNAQYPVAMIDEFQDTDPLQYQIFSHIYPEAAPDAESTRHSGLFMIGDPKQAIYAFRGADIFTYIGARHSVADHYTLGTNWRSTSAMVSAVNHVFQQASAPFIYDQDIPFLAVNPSLHADRKTLEVDGRQIPALAFWLDESSGEVVNKGTYEDTMAHATATQINNLLTAAQQGQCAIGSSDNQQPLSPGDIAVLVRTGTQGRMIRDALARQNIDSVYLSGGDSVFATTEAADLQLILSACLNPTDDRTLRAALACPLFNLNAEQLDQLNHDERVWEQAVDEFSHYRQLWQQQGVLAMLRRLLVRRQVAEQLLASSLGERRLTDLLHLGELLAAASQEVNNPHALLRWLSDHRVEPNHRAEEQQQHLESDRKLVQIVTIHKSKGLEYNVVFLPFICTWREQDQAFYHDDTQQAILDLTNNPDALKKADNERLAEDLRLLYVALTRPVHTCYIGLAPVSKGGRGKISDLHRMAIGYLLQGTDTGGLTLLKEKLEALTNDNPNISVSPPPGEQLPLYRPALDDTSELSSSAFDGHIERNWWVTSYSALSQHSTQAAPVKADTPDASLEEPGLDIDASTDSPDTDVTEPVAVPDEHSIFTFPRGAQAGTFLHSLFEQISFPTASGPDHQQFIREQLLLGGYDETWQPIAEQLVHDVLDCPLNDSDLKLRAINDDRRRVEMAFFLPMARIDAPSINRIIRTDDHLSSDAGLLDFQQVQGMLKGFIDLVFEHNGRYYVLDYKSNHLGYTAADYSQDAMRHAMIEHRYDFQYQLYTLALHRLLSIRLPDYDYEKNMGGVFYLFLRGMKAGDTSRNGVYHCRPSLSLISQLDELFSQGVAPRGDQTC